MYCKYVCDMIKKGNALPRGTNSFLPIYNKESANKKVAAHHTNLFLANSLLIGRAGTKQY